MAAAPKPTPTPSPTGPKTQDQTIADAVHQTLSQIGSAAASPSLSGDLPWYAGANVPAYSQHTSPLDLDDTRAHPMFGWSAGDTSGVATSLAGSTGGPLAAAGGGGAIGVLGQQFYTSNEAMSVYTQMSREQKIEVQKQLLASGLYQAASPEYYPSATSGRVRKTPNWGAQYDLDTFAALNAAFSAAIDTGQTLDAILSSTSAAANAAAQIWNQSTMVNQIEPSDVNELRAVADQQALTLLGRKATDAEKALAVSMVQGAQISRAQTQFNQQVAAKRSDAMQQYGMAAGTGTTGAAAGAPPTGTGGGVLDALMSAIGGEETRGSKSAYGEVNAQSGATGKYQILPSNWPEWSQAAGLGPNAPMSPQNQEIVARNQMSVYLRAGGGNPGYVAVAWYAGQGIADAWLKDPTNPKWNVKQKGGYPSVNDYAQSVTGKVNLVMAPGGAGGIDPAAGAPWVSKATVGDTTVDLSGAGTTPGGPTPAQLVPTSESVVPQVNPTADIAAQLRERNPMEVSAKNFADLLSGVRTLFHG